MHAIRKFLRRRDEAVSPVIAVILMVAITVVLAATVYVWVSGFSGSGTTPAKTISLTSNGAISASNKTYVVASASPGLKWSDLDFSLDGVDMTYANLTGSAAAANRYCVWDSANGWCEGSDPTDVISAGDILYIQDTGSLSGSTLRIKDASANSIITTITIG